MARLVLDDVLDSWKAEAPPVGFAARILGVAAESSLDAWEAERPPEGFAERVVSLAEKRHTARARTRTTWAAVAAVAAMAAIVAGLLVNPLPMPWRHPGQVVSTSVPVPPEVPSEQAAALPNDPELPAVSPPVEPAPLPSPTLKVTADTTARRPLKQPLPIGRQAPVVARRTPEPQPRLVDREELAPQRAVSPPGSDTEEAAFDLVAYKRARSSAVHREKRFNKTEGNGFGVGGSYRLAP